MNLQDFIAEERAQDPEFRAAYDEEAPWFERALALIGARRAAGITQEELAQRLGVTQPAVARLESGKHPPRLDTLQAVARATGVTFTISPTGAFTCVPPDRGYQEVQLGGPPDRMTAHGPQAGETRARPSRRSATVKR